MDERAFVEQKKPRWDELSKSLDRLRTRGPRSLSRDQLTELGAQYRTLVSDLSYARTQGASTELVSYLNELAGRAHGAVYAAPAARLRGLFRFLSIDFPQLFRSTWRYSLVAAVLFFVGWGVAAYLIVTDPTSAGAWLREFVGIGVGVQGHIPDPALMSSAIMTNNIKVGILAFAGGVTGGLLTLYYLVFNGLYIGARITVTIPTLGHLKIWSFILPHGLIELTAIFICGGAGLMIGGAIVAPGNHRRADAIKTAAGKAVRLFAGTLPFYVIAGTIEGFISPSVLPPQAKLLFGVLTGIALIIYLGFAGRKVVT